MQQNFLDPQVLAAISGLDLVAKTVVQGFVNGLHRSPNFGFSQEFAEYQMYSPGDDLRHVDWNVFARSERMYLKRFKGETNTKVTVLLDLSKSMSYGKTPNKLDYSRYLVSSLVYLAVQQRDSAGLILFDDEVRQFIPPSSRVGHLQKVLHAIEKAEVGQHTDFAKWIGDCCIGFLCRSRNCDTNHCSLALEKERSSSLSYSGSTGTGAEHYRAFDDDRS